MSSKIIEYHLARLQDKRVESRLDAIQQLVLLQAKDALEALKKVYETDDNEEVRKAAQNAGRAIFKSTINPDNAS